MMIPQKRNSYKCYGVINPIHENRSQKRLNDSVTVLVKEIHNCIRQNNTKLQQLYNQK